jgi:hypothetical protein
METNDTQETKIPTMHCSECGRRLNTCTCPEPTPALGPAPTDRRAEDRHNDRRTKETK